MKMATRQTRISFKERKKQTGKVKGSEEKENNHARETRSQLRLRIGSNIDYNAAIAQSESVDSSNSENDSDSGVECKPALKPLTPSKRKTNSGKGPVSPPKMTRANEQLTPSTQLSGLSLSSPFAEVRVTQSLSERLSRKELFPKPCNGISKARAELFPEPCDRISKARVALHTHATQTLPGREEELSKLNDFVKRHLDNGTSGSLYVSGPPGTGKTACLTNVMEQPDIKGRYTVVYINCTSMKSAAALYSRVVTQLKLKVRCRSEKAYLAEVEKYLQSQHKMMLMVLDEMDQLGSRGQSVLYTVFEWPATYPHGLVLVGISNALDLTDRTLPRLKAKPELTPELLHFAPYSKQQLVNIFTYRLNEARVGDVLPPVAIQLIATKVATNSGDVRKALDMARRVVEMSAQEQREKEKYINAKLQLPLESKLGSPRKSPRKPMAVIASPLKGTNSPQKSVCSVASERDSPCKTLFAVPPASHKDPASPRKCISSSEKDVLLSKKSVLSPKKESFEVRALPKSVGIKASSDVLKGVMHVVNEVYGTSHALGRSGDGGGEELPLQQKLAVCSLLLILRKGKNKDVSVGKLHEVYKRVCTKRHMDPLDQAAFLSMLGLIEARGLLHIQGKGKPGRLAKVCLQWVEDEVVGALKDRELLGSIMNDVACL